MSNKNLFRRDFWLILALINLACLLILLRFNMKFGVLVSALLLGLWIGILFTSELIMRPRLNQILKNIRSLRGNKKAKNLEKKEKILENIESELSGWAKDREEEINHLKKLENYRQEFIGNVSHELKTPIFNIQGYLHTLLDGGLKDDSINIKYLERSTKSVARLITIVEELETITQLEVGELELVFEKYDIASQIRELLESNELKANERKIGLYLLNNKIEEFYVMADQKRIRQVLANLISNSIRYGKEGGETKIKLSKLGGKVNIEVADNGIGIPEKEQSRIFERFFRADKSRSRELGGTGLGLSIVKHIIEAHRQKISVLSTEGAGSVFTFSLPSE